MSVTARRAAQESMQETACALCGRREYRVVASVDRRGRPLRTVMCDVCGLVWTNPRPANADVDAYYANDYRQDYAGSREPTRRKILRGLLGAAERRDAYRDLLRPGTRVLDVGCGAAGSTRPGSNQAASSRRSRGGSSASRSRSPRSTARRSHREASR